MPDGSSDVACACPPAWSTAPVTSSLACSIAGSSVMLIAVPPVGCACRTSVYDAAASGRGDRLEDVQPGGAAGGERGREDARERRDDEDLRQPAIGQGELRHALAVQRPDKRPAEADPDREAEEGAVHRDDHALDPDHPAQLTPLQAHRPQQAELTGPFNDR